MVSKKVITLHVDLKRIYNDAKNKNLELKKVNNELKNKNNKVGEGERDGSVGSGQSPLDVDEAATVKMDNSGDDDNTQAVVNMESLSYINRVPLIR